MTIYNTYRPTKFADVLGQASIAVLKQQAKAGAWHHSYLFYGASGTGKTTTARILAMALNCESLADGEPCGQCLACQQVIRGNHWDVHEIDGANFRGIDDIQELKRKAYLSPFGKRKVYIIDEAHMLTEPAFNAMLKLLEEPPPYLTIILCTTQKDKIPLTVLSRCQHFPFRTLETSLIRAKISRIVELEGKSLSDESMRHIVDFASGNMRSAENALGQALVMTGAK